MNKLGDCPKESIANVVMSRLYDDITRLESVTERLHGKLQPVMSNDYPCATAETGKAPYYPALFNDIRVICDRMESVTGSLENACSRIEL